MGAMFASQFTAGVAGDRDGLPPREKVNPLPARPGAGSFPPALRGPPQNHERAAVSAGNPLPPVTRRHVG